MKKNMGKTDRTIRICLAILFAVLIFTGILEGVISIILGIFAIIFLITSVIGFCPLYALIGISTCKIKGGKEAISEDK